MIDHAHSPAGRPTTKVMKGQVQFNDSMYYKRKYDTSSEDVRQIY